MREVMSSCFCRQYINSRMIQRNTQTTRREVNMEHIEREKIELGDDSSDPSSSSSSQLCLCRICHEEEEMKSNTMEAPCGCSGTLKFAHRGCIQKWCDEKGSTHCEICLQEFKPGYTFSPKASQLIDLRVTIRGSLEIPRQNYDPPATIYDSTESNFDDEESFRRPVPLTIATILLVWQLFALITGDDHYPFALTTVLLLRAGGILLPFYLVMRVVSSIRGSHLQQQIRHREVQRAEAMTHGDEDLDTQQHIVEIQF